MPWLYLPSDYKHRSNTTIVGKAKSGEISPKGLMAHTELWDGRVASTAAPNTMRYIWDKTLNKFRKMTFQEQVDRGYFILGKGPVGVRKQTEGIHEQTRTAQNRTRTS